MGPRFFKRGEALCHRFRRSRRNRFNGATLLQAWRARARRGITCRMIRFNGATLLQAWREYPLKIGLNSLYGFNGATLLQAWRAMRWLPRLTWKWQLQWGHASSSVESASCRSRLCIHTRFNGATLLQAWRAIPPATTARSRYCFNGATLLQAWRVHSAGSTRGKGRASMGPRFFKRGEFISAMSKSKRQRCFNGATLLQAWRADEGERLRPNAHALQWGHASSSVESNFYCAPKLYANPASMGPRFFKRGEFSQWSEQNLVE